MVEYLLNLLYFCELGERKREGAQTSSLIPPKKSKLGHSSSVVSGGIVRSTLVVTQDTSDAWEAFALEFDPSEFINLISDASNANDQDKVVSLYRIKQKKCYGLIRIINLEYKKVQSNIDRLKFGLNS